MTDHRRFLRVPSGDKHRQATLRFDGTTLACEFLNESAGGYGLAIPPDRAEDLPPGKIVVLDVHDLVIKARVAHARQEEEQFVLGLERIEEIEDKSITRQEQWSWLSALRSNGGQSASQTNPLRDAAIAGAFLLSLVILFFMPNLKDLFGGKKSHRRTTSSSASMFSMDWFDFSRTPTFSPPAIPSAQDVLPNLPGLPGAPGQPGPAAPTGNASAPAAPASQPAIN